MLDISATPGGRRVAVIGAGPAGLTAAKHLLEEGLEPVVLEQSDDLGGQWHATAAHSAAWPGMRTNTSRTTTAFSDFPMAPAASMFPTAEDVHSYLREYAAHFGVSDHVLTGTRVVEVRRAPEGWTVRLSRCGLVSEERFAGVIVASGRFRRPRLPELPGLAKLAADGRARHSFHYAGREEFRGQRVLVYGNSISGLEIASDLAADHTIEVISAARRPRYILQKIVRGFPTDWRLFNRLSALLGRVLEPEQVAEGIRATVLAETGDPARYGGLAVDPDTPPKLSMNQEYLAYVAEGRISARGAVRSVHDGVARFAAGPDAEVDDVICATGYDLDVAYLADEVREIVQADDTHLDLYARTFHPDLPGLAFLGQFLLIGPQFPTVELQARWVAGVWSGALPSPEEQRMRAGIAEHRAARAASAFDMYPALAAMLADELGVEPEVAGREDLAEGLLFGPLAPARWRLDGHGARPGAEALLTSALHEFGPPPPPAPQQVEALKLVAGALEDQGLAEIAERLERDQGVVVAAP